MNYKFSIGEEVKIINPEGQAHCCPIDICCNISCSVSGFLNWKGIVIERGIGLDKKAWYKIKGISNFISEDSFEYILDIISEEKLKEFDEMFNDI